MQALRVPVSDDPNDGSIRTRDGATGAIYTSTLVWDEQAQTITDTSTGTVYAPNDRGSFVAEDGTTLPTGWAVHRRVRELHHAVHRSGARASRSRS